MKALVQIVRAAAETALRIEEHPDPVPAAGEIVIAMEAAPVHRTDIVNLTGESGAPMRPLPRVPGTEGVGRVSAAAPDVTRFKVGDRVFPPKWSGTFREKLACAADAAYPAPEGVAADQLCILCTMGLTAILLLDDHADLPAGAWIIQDGANSSIGRLLIGMAHARGLKTVNVVRRAGLERELHALGADAVVVDSGDADALAGAVSAATGGAPVHLGIDMIGGALAGRLAHSLSPPSKLVLNGSNSGEAARIEHIDINRKDMTIVGMGMSRSFNRRDAAGRDEIYRRMGQLAADGKIRTGIAGRFRLEEFAAAYALEAKPSAERTGKALFVFG